VTWRNLSKTAEKKFLQPMHSECISNEWKIGVRRLPLCMGIVWMEILSKKKVFVQTSTKIHFWRTKVTIESINTTSWATTKKKFLESLWKSHRKFLDFHQLCLRKSKTKLGKTPSPHFCLTKSIIVLGNTGNTPPPLPAAP
jgi:hypothetical protein